MSHWDNVFHHTIATHPENGLWSHKPQPNPRHETGITPNADLRETTNMYYLEVELPGINGPHDIDMHWLEEGTLQIRATIYKTNLEAVWYEDKDSNKSEEQAVCVRGLGNNCDEKDILGQRRARRGSDVASTMRFWLNERRTGVFVRDFCFAVAVDMQGLQARLSEGLLMVMLPKRGAGAFEAKEIFVQGA